MKRLYYAFLYSLSGIKSAWQDEPAFRLEVLVSALLIPAAFILSPDKISLILLVGSVLLVLLVELINSAVEAAIDRIGTEIHPLAKKAKDTASAAVLVALIYAGLVWFGVFFF